MFLKQVAKALSDARASMKKIAVNNRQTPGVFFFVYSGYNAMRKVDLTVLSDKDFSTHLDYRYRGSLNYRTLNELFADIKKKGLEHDYPNKKRDLETPKSAPQPDMEMTSFTLTPSSP